ncbi:MAG: hypothetical protein K6B44_10130 [Lachnospiraceae bacterium]|nr:hypothetical protein [Lachnospiraceae bacterium]
MSCVRKAELIAGLYQALTGEAVSDATDRAFGRGWIEAHDRKEAEENISRLDAARIVHLFLLKETEIPDLKDISGAAVLRDLYDCRVCVNHIAQVYLRGLIAAAEIEGISKEKFLIFDGKASLTDEDAVRIYERIRCIKQDS